MKKIAVLVSGGIRIYPKNKLFLKKIFKGLDVRIIACVWKSQKQNKIFKKIYNVKYNKYINLQKWNSYMSKVTYVTGEENRSYKVVNIFHMWYSIVENLKFLKKIRNENFDYVCRFRSDLYFKNRKKNLLKEILKIKDNQLIFPENNHYRGLNDQFFIGNYTTVMKFTNFFKFIKSFLKEKRTLNPEYLLYFFLKKNNIKYKIVESFKIKVLGQNLKSHLNYSIRPSKKAFVPLKDKINMKTLKYKMRLIKINRKIQKILN